MKYKNSFQILTLFVTYSILSNCASSVPRNELQNLPSLIEIQSLNLINGDLKIRISHRNNLTRKSNQLSCQLALKDFKAIKFNEIPLPDLTNYAVETIEIKLPTTDLPGIDQNTQEMPYVLDCFLFSQNFREEHLIKISTLFPVPGSQADYR